MRIVSKSPKYKDCETHSNEPNMFAHIFFSASTPRSAIAPSHNGMLLRAYAVRSTSAVPSRTQTRMARHQESGQDPLRLFLRQLSDFPDRCCVLLHSITSIPSTWPDLAHTPTLKPSNPTPNNGRPSSVRSSTTHTHIARSHIIFLPPR